MNAIAQYDSFLSIYISLLAIIPCVIAGFFGKRSKILNLIISIIMIVTILGLRTTQMVEFLAFLIFEILLIYLYLWYRKNHTGKFVYYLIFNLSIVPIFVVRVTGALHFYESFIGFVGLSYLCFKIWQVIIEIHDGNIKSLKLLDIIGLLLFFPSFSSGPIIRYGEMESEYQAPISRGTYFNDYVIPGLKKIVFGLFYKFAIAFFVNTYIMAQIPKGFTVLYAVLYAYAYTVYLFFDFAGYSNIAIGFGYLMGVKLPANFDKPFLARNMKEFWGRWHMSLSRWFTDYVFGRVVLNGVRNKLFKNTKIAARVAYIITMTTMGLWHGFSLHYLAYGLYQGAILVVTDIYVRSKTYRKYKKKKWFNWVSRVICFQFIALGMVIFSGNYWTK